MKSPFNALIILIFLSGMVIWSWRTLPLLPKSYFWSLLLLMSVSWFLVEIKMNWKDRKKIKNALLLGLFLMVFDFIFENAGFYLGLWQSSYSMLFVLTVPVEIMGTTLFGGAAWALHLPKKFDKTFSISDILTFSFFGALGEFILLSNGIMVYTGGWNSLYAFVSYLATWIILHSLRYRLLKE